MKLRTLLLMVIMRLIGSTRQSVRKARRRRRSRWCILTSCVTDVVSSALYILSPPSLTSGSFHDFTASPADIGCWDCVGLLTTSRRSLSPPSVNSLPVPCSRKAYFLFSFSAFTLLVGRQEEQPACKKMCWRSYLSGVRCKWLAYGRADATATSSLASLKFTLF